MSRRGEDLLPPRAYHPGMRCLLLLAVLVAAACGPAPGYDANGQFVGDPNAGLASPRRGPPPGAPQGAQPQTSGGQAPSSMQQGNPEGDPFYDQLSAASGGAPQPAPAACDDSCRFANNGECDDGREGSDTDVCAPGTDCTDCGN